MKKFLLTLGVITLFAASAAFAVDPPPIDPTSPDPVPVDGGASLLLAAGTSYGLKKLRNRKKK